MMCWATIRFVEEPNSKWDCLDFIENAYLE